MAASTTIFVLLGITAVTANLMKVITYLDQPRRKDAPRPCTRITVWSFWISSPF